LAEKGYNRQKLRTKALSTHKPYPCISGKGYVQGRPARAGNRHQDRPKL